MKKEIITYLFLTLFLTLFCVVGAPDRLHAETKDYTDFNKGIAYFLLEDQKLAAQYLDAYFQRYQDPALRGAFFSLLESKEWEVTLKFKRYLDRNHRSTEALVGISLSTTEMENTTTLDNLKRAVRVNSRFSSAYLCQGYEYLKEKNYPAAQDYFRRALAQRYRVPEYKILLARLHFELGQPAQVLELVKAEADRQPDNFYFNFQTARAYYQLNQLEEMENYIKTAVEVSPANQEAKLMLARFQLSRRQAQKARNILKDLKFPEYHEGYYKTYAEVLLELKGNDSKNYLDQVYAANKWDPDVNRLMGLYYTWKNKGNVQNWVNRALLSGNNPESLQKTFPRMSFTEPPSMPFFQVDAVRWVTDKLLLVGARKVSGAPENLYLVRVQDLKILGSVAYKGQLQDIFFNKKHDRALFSTVAAPDASIYIYGLDIGASSLRLRPIYSGSLDMPAPLVGFNYTGTLAYITDKRIEKMAFESPFAITSQIGEKNYVYPSYPFPIYMYNFAAGRLTAFNDLKALSKVPIDAVRRYNNVHEIYEKQSSIQGLIQKGQALDLTSSELVKIFFAPGEVFSFIIYLSDLKNAFQSLVYEYTDNKLLKVDETMFLGEGNYAELTLLDYQPQREEILVLTTDQQRRIIKYNYGNRLAIQYADKVLQHYYDPLLDLYYILTERSKKKHYTETSLELVYREPFLRKTITERRDLEKILFTRNVGETYFTTYTGETVMMDADQTFHYICPSFEGCVHEISPSRDFTAAFINGRLFVVKSAHRPERRSKRKPSSDQ